MHVLKNNYSIKMFMYTAWSFAIAMLILACNVKASLANNSYYSENESFSKSPYHWIKHNKIRSAYLYFYNPISKIRLVKKLGLNTIIIGCYRLEDEKYKHDTISAMWKWAKAARDNNLNLFFAINWQPYPQVGGHNFNVIFFDDGTKGIAICPLDDKFWDERIKFLCLLIANMSNEPDLRVDGIFLDMEIYGSEKEPQIKRDYYEQKSDYSDTSFFAYLNYLDYKISDLPKVKLSDRKNWLLKNNLLDDYFSFLKMSIKSKAANLKKAVHNINPKLLIGIYPHPNKENFVHYPLAQGLSSSTLPLVIFGIHSYGYKVDINGDGYTLIPEDIKNIYQQDNINCLYVPGYLFRKYDGSVLERNLKHSLINYDGYWLFELPLLWKAETNTAKTLPLKDSAENLEKAVIRSNY